MEKRHILLKTSPDIHYTMPYNRFFYPYLAKVSVKTECELDEKETHHLRNVMKCEAGDLIELIDGCGYLATARVQHTSKRACLLQIEQIFHQPKNDKEIWLALGITRPSSMEYTIEKCTEIGASHFIFFSADYSGRDCLTASTKNRLETIIKSALKQSGRLYIPEIHYFSSLEKAAHFTPSEAFYGDLSLSARPFLEALHQIQPFTKSAALYIGPEKGWSDSEKILLQTLFPQRAISLSDNILRAETAAIAGCYALWSMLR